MCSDVDLYPFKLLLHFQINVKKMEELFFDFDLFTMIVTYLFIYSFI